MAATIEYQNPIIAGFAPDPSIVYVENEDLYFLVNSSFHVFPGLPIYASKTLKEWSHIGNAINRPGQIQLANAQTENPPFGSDTTLTATGGLFAPTIRWHKGTFYIICTNCITEAEGHATYNFYVSSTDIWSDKWTDPILFDFRGIDPSIFFDDDGKVYIQGSWRAGPLHQPQCTIRQFEVDIHTGKPLSEIKELWAGYAGTNDVEGPHIYRKDQYYYLLTAEAGTFEHHLIAIARSRSIWGPYKSYENNPILTADGTDEYIQHTGHGDLFQDRDGSWWCACLGVRKEEDSSYPLGRESFLMPVSWPENDWPRIDLPRMSFTRNGKLEISTTAPQPKARADHVFLRDPALEDYKFSSNTIQVVARHSGLSTPTGTTTFVGVRQRSLDCSATVTLTVPRDPVAVRAGLTIFKDQFRHGDIYYDSAASTICLEVTNVGMGEPRLTKQELSSKPESVTFKITAENGAYEFFYRKEMESGWNTLGTMSYLEMTAWDFTGPIFGVFGSTLREGGVSLTFENFDIKI